MKKVRILERRKKNIRKAKEEARLKAEEVARMEQAEEEARMIAEARKETREKIRAWKKT